MDAIGWRKLDSMDSALLPRASTTRQRLAASLRMALANLVLGSIIGNAWLDGLSSATSVRVFIFTYGALVSSVACLALVPALILAGLSKLLPFERLLGWIHATAWTAFLLLIFSDTRIYAILGYHFNSAVWNVFTTPGSGEAVAIGPGDWVPALVATILTLLGQRALWRFFVSRLRSRTPRPWVLRPTSWMLVCVLAMAATEGSLYASAGLTRDHEITSRSRRFPVYLPSTVEKFARDTLGYDLTGRRTIELVPEGSELAYPVAAPYIPAGGPRPNILIVVIDSLRQDMLSEEHMPVVSEWAGGARRFANHLSGGNATRFGLFSLLYGLHGSYWTAVHEERCPPVLITTLTDLGYEPLVLSGASMDFPELRSTAWVTIEERVEDRFPKEMRRRDLRDDKLAERFDGWLAERGDRPADPFFVFVLLDTPHQPYWPAPDLEPNKPFADGLDYLKLASSPSAEEVSSLFNRYKNAVAHADRVTGRILASLERHGQADTLVVVTGDHGEEFFENGQFGHTGNFSAAQVAVPFLLRGPGIEAGLESLPTAHVDLVPTLLELLGADAAQRSAYCLGHNLLEPPRERLRVVSGWSDLGLWGERGILSMPVREHGGLVQAFDYSWRVHPAEAALIRDCEEQIREVTEECHRFLR